MLTFVSTFLHGLMNPTEQSTSAERWQRIRSKIFEKPLGGRPLKGPSLALANGWARPVTRKRGGLPVRKLTRRQGHCRF
jgi:hypothetical protein